MENLTIAYPGAVQVRNDDGYIPVHSAIKNKCQEKAIHILVDCWPESLSVPDENGALCIHLACMYGAALLITYIYVNLPSAISIKDDYGNLPLHLIIRECNSHTHNFIKSTVEWFRQATLLRNNDGDLPIHLVCRHAQQHEQPFLIARTILKWWPDSVAESNHEGMLPLHIICQNYESLPMLSLVHQCYTDAAIVRAGSHGKTPLHFALECPPQQQLAVTDALLQENTACVRIRDNNGNLPIHISLQSGLVNLRVVELLIGAWPKSLVVRNKMGLLPLHLACYHQYPHIISYVMGKNTAAIKAKDRNGWIPLHYACSNNVVPSTEVLRQLVNEYPESCKVACAISITDHEEEEMIEL